MDAREYLKNEIQPNGDLSDQGRYLHYFFGEETATLDGTFTAQDLRMIAEYMEKTKK